MMLLLGANALVLGLSALRTSVWRRHWWVAGLGLLLLLHLLIDGFYQSLVPVYVLTVVLIAVGFRRHKTKGTTLKARVVHVAWGGIWRLAAVVLLAASVVATWNFGNSRFFPLLFAENSVDFSELGWSDAFDRMNEQLAGDYAFGDWKALDWEALHDRFSPYFIAGERAQDLDAYYLALREYVYSLPDGHFGLYVVSGSMSCRWMTAVLSLLNCPKAGRRNGQDCFGAQKSLPGTPFLWFQHWNRYR